MAAVVGAERFLHEIKIAAKLNHPHILTLIDSGEADGFLYYVMPYVQGESLKDKLLREKQLSVEDALAITQDVASAMAHAHTQGVIHRDLKPGNILLHEGEAMVADFGLALALRAAGGQRLTETGMSLGTPEYMSPEQATADHEVDARSDIYSLGAVLYELLAGEPPHTGRSTQAIIAKLLTEQPTPLRILRNTVPEAVDRAVMKALAKVPADRFSTTVEFAARLGEGSMAGPMTTSKPLVGARPITGLVATVSRGTKAITASALVIIAVAIVAFLTRSDAEPAAVGAPRHTQLTFSGQIVNGEISPNGELLAHVARVADTMKLLVRDLAGGTTLEIGSVGEVFALRWSPDGTQLLFTGEMEGQWRGYVVPRFGGTPRSLPRGFSQYAVWSPDGAQVAQWFQARPQGLHHIWFTDLATQDTDSIVLPGSITFLGHGDWSPNGEWITFFSTSGTHATLWTVAVDGSGLYEVMEDPSMIVSSPQWSSSGDAIYYNRADELRKVAVSRDGRPKGAPEVLQAGLQLLQASVHNHSRAFSITTDGRKLVYTKAQGHSNVWLATADRPGKDARFTTTQLTRGTARKSSARLSPDGRWIAFVQFVQTKGDVFVLPIDGGTPRRVTSGGQVLSHPVWSPEGRALAFLASVQGVTKLQTVVMDGGRKRTYEAADVGDMGLAWAPGDRILYQRPGNRNFHLLDPTTEAEEPLVANDSVGWMFEPHYSPDGDHVAVSWTRAQRGVWVISLRDSSQTLVRAGQQLLPLGWSADGGWVYTQDWDSRDILRVPWTGGDGIVIATVPFENAGCTPVERPAGLAWLCRVSESVSDIWMIENFDPAMR